MLIQGIIMFRFKKYIVLTILVSLLGHLPLWAFNQQATEKLRQGIIAGNPDTVKASISEGADINTKYGADQETPLMLALREYIKAAQASAKMSNPWNVAMLATGVVSSGVSAGLAAAMKPKIPGPPNLGATSEEAKMQAAAAMKLRGKRGRESTIMTGVSSPNAPAANPVKNVLGL